jgi:hypothetical protein
LKLVSPKARKRVRHCHPMIADAALAIVMESYDALMHDDFCWASWKAQHPGASSKKLEDAYLAYNWGKAVEAAREALTRALNPALAPALSEEDRVKIHEALVLDASLKMGRRESAFVRTVN